MSTSLLERPVAAILSVGAQTAVGRSAPASAAAVRAGLANFTAQFRAVDLSGKPVITANAPWLPAEITSVQRMSSLAASAAEEAIHPALALLSGSHRRVSMYLGLPLERPGFDRAAANEIVRTIQRMESLRDLLGNTRVICGGHAAGLMAIELACRQMEQGTEDFCLVGAVDSYLDARTIRWLEECGQLHSPSNAWGFVPGEGAAFCLLASTRSMKEARFDPLALVLAVNTSFEANRIKTRTVCTGDGLTQAFRATLDALPDDAKVDGLICDLNGEPYRADEFGFALVRTSARFRRPGVFRAPADCWGDVGAASGILFATLPVIASQRRYAAGSYFLLSIGSETGERCTCLLAVKEHPKRTLR